VTPDCRTSSARTGLRCGTKSPVIKPGTVLDGGPGDCSLVRTNPLDEYHPTNVLEITVVVHRFESPTGLGVFPDSLVRTQIPLRRTPESPRYRPHCRRGRRGSRESPDPPGIGEPLAVIAPTSGDDALASFLLCEDGERGETIADLERVGRVVILVLD